MYSGWELPEICRSKLLSYIPPIYRDRFPRGIVYQFKTTIVPTMTVGDVVGSFDNKEGQQVLVLSINGNILRPDGRIIHIPWSRDAVLIGRKPFSSTDPLIITDWQTIDVPITVQIIPKLFDV